MAATIEIPAGGYRYIPYAFQYSGGVEALRRLPDRAGGIRASRCRSPPASPGSSGTWASWVCRSSAFCACELRSPAQFTDAGFIAFNRHYTETLKRWGVMKNDDDNPVARSNVIPPLHKPAEPSFYAFCFAASRRWRVRVLRHRRQRRGRRRTSAVQRAHGPLGRDQPRCDAREGGVRARADGGAHGGARQDLGRHHGDAGLHGA